MYDNIRLRVFFVLCTMFSFASIPFFLVGDDEKSKIEITNIQFVYAVKSINRIKQVTAISINGSADLKPDTVLKHRLGIELETLDGILQREIFSIFSRVSSESYAGRKKFQGRLAIDMQLPPCPVISGGRYYIITSPAEWQMKKDVNFSDAEKNQLTNKYYFTTGVLSDQVLYIENEYATLEKYIGTIKPVFQSLPEIRKRLDETLLKDNLPANDPELKEWHKTSEDEVVQIVAKMGALSNGNFITYFPQTYDKLKLVCDRLVYDLYVMGVIISLGSEGLTTMPKNDSVPSISLVDANVDEMGSEIEKLQTKEAIFNLSLFLDGLSCDLLGVFASPKIRPTMIDSASPQTVPLIGVNSVWNSKKLIWGNALNEFERFINNFNPPAAILWKECSELLAEQLKAINKQLELYAQLSVEKPGDISLSDIEENKNRIDEIFLQIKSILKR